MSSFHILPSPSASGATVRLGRLITGSGHVFDTPAFIAPSSRGAVPHLSPDSLRNCTKIKGVYAAFEDFVEKPPGKQPIFTTPATLRQFIALPSSQFTILAPRRAPPINCPASNTDDSISILTSVGYRFLTCQDYVQAVRKLRPDVVIGMPDLPDKLPGKNRTPKMVMRTELWLKALLGRNKEFQRQGLDGEPPEQGEGTLVFAPLLPLEFEQQRLYLEFLGERKEEIGGLAVYDYKVLQGNDGTLEEMGLVELPRLSLDVVMSPLGVLEQIEAGVDVVSSNFVQEATDAGIALDFYFPGVDVGLHGTGKTEGEKNVLGLDMWSTEYSADLRSISFGLGGGQEGDPGQGRACECHACTRHHRAYIQHLLQAKEMTGWVLLQIHNYHILEKFFAALRKSLSTGTYEADKSTFLSTYISELPKRTGEGPRVRGYQFKTEGGAKKKNSPAFRSKGQGFETGSAGSDDSGVKCGDEREEAEGLGIAVRESGERGQQLL